MMMQKWVVQLWWKTSEGTGFEHVSSSWPVGTSSTEVLSEAAEQRNVTLSTCENISMGKVDAPYESTQAPSSTGVSTKPAIEVRDYEAEAELRGVLDDALSDRNRDPKTLTTLDALGIFAVGIAIQTVVDLYKVGDARAAMLERIVGNNGWSDADIDDAIAKVPGARNATLASLHFEAIVRGVSAANPYLIEMISRRLRSVS